MELSMADLPQLSRRKALKILSGAPLLPLGLTACGGGTATVQAALPAAPAAQYLSTIFSASTAPTLANPAAMATTSVSSMLYTQFTDGTQQSFNLAYQPFFLTG